MMTGIVCDGLRKRYGEVAALDGLDLCVPAGSVYGLLGPNGAGKTTAVRVLATLLRPDGGRAEVAGYDVVRQPKQVRARIGLVGQQPAVDEILSGRQNLVLFGRLYHLGGPAARHRAGELLDTFGLAEAADRPVGSYSGGLRRRLDLAASFLLAPPVLFLDEPTSGLDPRNRAQVWQSVRALAAAGTTVLLTTQHLDEADQLATGIAIVEHGRVVATGTPDELKARTGTERIDIVLDDPGQMAAVVELIRGWLAAEPTLNPDARLVSGQVRDRAGALAGVVRTLDEHGIGVRDIALRRPTLDEAFLRLTEIPA
jgi:ABC-2 type transport system ATP-binding protein